MGSRSTRARNGGFADATQPAIVEALREAGASVQSITIVGHSCPDLLVGYRRRTYLLEVKSPGGKVTAEQLAWHSSWAGFPVAVVLTPEEALRAIGAIS